MRITSLGVVAAALAAITLLSGSQAGPTPAEQFAAIARAYLGMSLPSDWDGIEKLPGTRWAPLPPTSLKNCLPNGDCFARQGSVSVGGRSMTVVATGARTMVVHLLFRNVSAPLGEDAVVAALEKAAMTPRLARCPANNRDGGTDWYSLQGKDVSPGHLAIQSRCKGKPCEGFVLTYREKLPPLEPSQLALYSEHCAEGSERKVVSSRKPPELVAGAL
jgi:hypothetical protein